MTRGVRAPRTAAGNRLRTFLGVFLATFVVAGGGATAAAVWTAPPVTLAGTVTAATVAVTLSGTAAIGNTAAPYKFVGAGTASTPLITPLLLANTGSSPLTLALTTATTSSTTPALAADVQVTTWAGSAGACAATIPASNTTVGTLASLPALPPGATTAAVGQTVTLCVATRLLTTVRGHQGETASATFTLRGTVGSAWKTEVSAAPFTQQVYRVAPPAAITCVNDPGLAGIGGSAIIGVTRVPDAATYTVSRTANGITTTVATLNQTAAGTNPSITIGALQVGLLENADITIAVVANEAVTSFNTTSTPVTKVVRYSNIGSLLAVRCVP